MNKVFLTGQKKHQLSETTIWTSWSFETDPSCQVNENTTYPMKRDFVRLICRFEMMSNHWRVIFPRIRIEHVLASAKATTSTLQQELAFFLNVKLKRAPTIKFRWHIFACNSRPMKDPASSCQRCSYSNVQSLHLKLQDQNTPKSMEILWVSDSMDTHTELRNHHNLDTLRASCRLRMAIYQTKLINLKPLGDLELFLACYLSCQLHLQVSSKDHWISHVGPMETGIGTPMRPAMMLAHLKSRILVLPWSWVVQNPYLKSLYFEESSP